MLLKNNSWNSFSLLGKRFTLKNYTFQTFIKLLNTYFHFYHCNYFPYFHMYELSQSLVCNFLYVLDFQALFFHQLYSLLFIVFYFVPYQHFPSQVFNKHINYFRQYLLDFFSNKFLFSYFMKHEHILCLLINCKLFKKNSSSFLSHYE